MTHERSTVVVTLAKSFFNVMVLCEKTHKTHIYEKKKKGISSSSMLIFYVVNHDKFLFINRICNMVSYLNDFSGHCSIYFCRMENNILKIMLIMINFFLFFSLLLLLFLFFLPFSPSSLSRVLFFFPSC